MQVITEVGVSPWPESRSVVTVGAYDGVHLGHQAVVDHVREQAAATGARAVVVTFDRHPASVVRPESAPPQLTSLEQKLELLEATGVDATVVVTFDIAQAKEEPEMFVERVLVNGLGVSRVIVGADFHFGHNRGGNVAFLRHCGKHFDFTVEPLDLLARSDADVDEPVSSTAIRRALAGGDVTRATAMLGRPHEVRGSVVLGDQRGRLIGFPTANVEVPNSICVPADGVYAGHYGRPDGSLYRCAINIGRRPTFYEHADHSLLEAHLLDFDGDLYGEPAKVRLEHFLRSERKFDGIEAIAAQLRQDVEHARALLS